MTERRRIRILAGLAVVAAVVLVVAVARQMRTRPCAGDPIPATLDALAAGYRELPVIARPVLKESEQSSGCMVSYPTSGTRTYALGPFVLREIWSQSGTDAHPLGPPAVTLWIAPAAGGTDPAWASPIFDATDYQSIVDHLELRRGDDGYILVAPPLSYPALQPPAPAWKPFILPLPQSPDPNRMDGITFRIVRHPAGHRGSADNRVWGAAVFLLAAALALWKSWGLARMLDWREGTVDEDGWIVPDDGTERARSTERIPRGEAVLFRAGRSSEAYRESGAPPAIDVCRGSIEILRSKLRKLAWLTVPVLLIGAALAASALPLT